MSRVPHVYALLFFVILVAAATTYLIPTGEYERTVDSGQETVVEGSYEEVTAQPVGILGIFQSIHMGMVEAADIIFFVFVVGGAFGVLQATGATEAGIGAIAERLGDRGNLLIPVIMIVFSLAGATIGMAEETIPFVVMMVPLAMALGFDRITGAAMVLVGAGTGFATAPLNPFTVGVAQGIADVPLFSGIGFRIILWVIFTSVAIVYVMRHANNVARDPQSSPTFEEDRSEVDTTSETTSSNPVTPSSERPSFTGRHALVVTILGATFVGLAVGVITAGWYLTELAGLFLLMGVAVGIAGRLGTNGTARAFVSGCEVIAMGALVVGVARAVLVVLEDGRVLDTMLFGAATSLEGFPSSVALVGMYVFQALTNFLVPSGSGQAALTMPVMAPLADLTGVTRQVAVLAYQLGDGISNIITPTSGYFMAALALAGISWVKWAKWILPLVLIEYSLGLVALLIAHAIGYS